MASRKRIGEPAMNARFIFPPRILLAAALVAMAAILSPCRAADDISVTAKFDPPQLAAGQEGDYKLQIDGSVENPKGSVPGVPGLSMRVYNTESGIQIVNSNVSRTLTIYVRVQAASPGNYTVPTFDLEINGKKYPVPAVTLQVTDKPVAPRPSSPASAIAPTVTDSCVLTANVTRTDIYVGEKFPIDITLSWRPEMQPQPSGDLTQDNDAFERVSLEGKPQQGSDGHEDFARWSKAITALEAGPQKLSFSFPLVVMVPSKNSPVNDPRIAQFFSNMPSAFSEQEPFTAQSAPLELNVLPLPAEGRPGNFTGGIGVFTAAQPTLSSTDLQVGAPVTLKLTVSGNGNFDRLQAPALDLGTLWRTYPTKDTFKAKDDTGFSGVKTFEYVLMPMSDKITQLPAPEFNFFNPETKSYVEFPLQPIAVTVKAAEPGQALPPLPTVAAAPATEQKPQLVGLHFDPGSWQAPDPLAFLSSPYFYAAQAAPAILFGALVITRRRRLRLENDPAYARRLRAQQHARTALAQARTAAKSGYAAEFYAVAQRALQEAASQDRADAAAALTWQEFDAHLAARGTPADIRQQTREIFDAGDALRFGGFAPDQASLAVAAARLDKLVQELLQKK
jgi:hypothetical protein